MTNRSQLRRTNRALVVAALAVILLAAASAIAIGRSADNCAEPLVCVSRIGGGGCLPGPCAADRHTAAFLADTSMVAGLILGAVLLAVGLRPGGSTTGSGG